MSMRRILSAMFATLLITNTSWAAVFNVSTEAEFQTALTTSESNGEADTIIVSAVTLNVSATLTYAPVGVENFSLTVQGAGPGNTILDGSGVRRGHGQDGPCGLLVAHMFKDIGGLAGRQGQEGAIP